MIYVVDNIVFLNRHCIDYNVEYIFHIIFIVPNGKVETK